MARARLLAAISASSLALLFGACAHNLIPAGTEHYDENGQPYAGHEADHEQTEAHHDPNHGGEPLHLTHDDDWKPTEEEHPHAGPMKGGPKPAAEPGRLDGITAAHNRLRADVGVPLLTWSPEIAAYAQKWADELQKNNCELRHRPAHGKNGRRYGENLFWMWGHDAHGNDVLNSWGEEKRFYVEKTGECQGGICGHYTQVVWHNTTEVGCGMAECGKAEVWVCNYNPPGNYLGERAYTPGKGGAPDGTKVRKRDWGKPHKPPIEHP